MEYAIYGFTKLFNTNDLSEIREFIAFHQKYEDTIVGDAIKTKCFTISKDSLAKISNLSVQYKCGYYINDRSIMTYSCAEGHDLTEKDVGNNACHQCGAKFRTWKYNNTSVEATVQKTTIPAGFVIKSSLLLDYDTSSLLDDEVKHIEEEVKHETFPLNHMMNQPPDSVVIKDDTYTYDLSKVDDTFKGILIYCVCTNKCGASYNPTTNKITIVFRKDMMIKFLMEEHLRQAYVIANLQRKIQGQDDYEEDPFANLQ